MLLEKWYLDAVFPDGTVWIGYRARLRLFGCLPISWCAGCEIPPVGAQRKVTRWKNLPAPCLADGAWNWTGPDGFDGRWLPSVAGVKRTLASDDRLRIHWNCIAPRAVVERKDGIRGTTRGVGYLECLRVESARLGFPFRDLWWGHACAGQSSLVWLRWGDGRDLSLLLEDGVPTDGRFDTLADGGVSIWTARNRWETAPGRTLCNGDLRRSFPAWLVWLTGGMAPAQELKIAGSVRHTTAPGIESAGTGVWEKVRWA